MNKFTRSQMGKIMAYALSAAMAVTVVPTYMMKPLVAEAAQVDTDAVTLGTSVATLGGITATENTTVGLFSKDTDLVANTHKKPVCEITATTKEHPAVASTPEYEFVIPYSLAAGTYYVAEKSEDDGDGYEDAANILKAIVVTSASAVTGVSLDVSNSTINYETPSGGSAGTTVSNTNAETVKINFSGADNKNCKAIYVNGTKVNVTSSSTPQTISGDNVNDNFTVTYNYGDTITVKSAKIPDSTAGADKLTLNIEVYVAGRKSPFTRTVTFTAVGGMTTVSEATLTLDNQIAEISSDVKVTTAIAPANSKENITYEIKGTAATGSTTAVAGSSGIIKLKGTGDKTVATFDTTTGIFNATKADTYTITAKNNVGDDKGHKDVKIIDISIPTVIGTVGNASQTVAISPAGLDDVFASYSVADEEIAQVSGTTEDISAKLLKPGITEITGDFVVYGDKAYNFQKKGYVVVAPKSSDEFTLTDIPNTELYVNELGSYLTSDIAGQLADAIVAGQVDSSKLKSSVFASAEAELASDLTSYYAVLGTDSSNGTDVEATGLLFNAYDENFVNVEDPEEYKEVGITVSPLQAKDEQYRVKDSVVNFVAEATVDGDVIDVNSPVWLKVTNNAIKNDTVYTVYDDGEAVYTVKSAAAGNTLTFQTDSFSVFSIVETPDAEVTDNTAGFDKPDTPDTDDIYDKVNFSAHVQRRIGTDDEADIAATVSDDGIISLGTHGQSRRVEKITLNGLDPDSVEMTAHVQKRVDHPEDVADLTQVVNEDGSISIGTEHQSRRIEAFSMNLKGDLAEKYDVYYRVHAQNYGWLGWAKNGEIAGTSGHSFRLEGIEIIFVEKGTEFDESQYVKTPEEGDRGYSEKAAYMDRVVSEK